MDCLLLIGLQGSGKSAFFKQRFADTHVRINRDMLKTKAHEGNLARDRLRDSQVKITGTIKCTAELRTVSPQTGLPGCRAGRPAQLA